MKFFPEKNLFTVYDLDYDYSFYPHEKYFWRQKYSGPLTFYHNMPIYGSDSVFDPLPTYRFYKYFIDPIPSEESLRQIRVSILQFKYVYH